MMSGMEQSELILSLELFNSKSRPSFSYYSNGIEIITLFDTGASTPVWCMGEKKFLKAYPDAIKKDTTCKISGFGKTSEEGLIYTIPKFILSNNGIEYCIIDLQIAVCRHPSIGFDFVLSDTMFSKADTLIYRREKKHLDIIFEKPEYQCLVSNKTDSFSISTFVQT